MNVKFPIRLALAALLLAPFAPARADFVTADFENIDLDPATNTHVSSSPGGHYDSNPTGSGSTGEGSVDGSFTSGGATFSNNYVDGIYGKYWSGFAVSNVVNVTDPGYDSNFNVLNPAAAFDLANDGPFNGSGGSRNYAVASAYNPDSTTGDPDAPFYDAVVNLAAGTTAHSIDVNNATYTALAIRDGSGRLSKKFGGELGTDPDFFKLTITGYSGLGATGVTVGKALDFYLADYRTDTKTIISAWTTLDLTGLGDAKSLAFSLTTTDTNEYGARTPTFFAVDNLVMTVVPEPSSLILVGTGGLGLLAAARRRRAKTA